MESENPAMVSVNPDHEQLLTAGSFQEALRVFEAEWFSCKINFGLDSPQTVRTQVRYADVLRMAGDYDEAVKIYGDILLKMGSQTEQLTDAIADVRLSLANIVYNKNFSEAAALVDEMEQFFTKMPTDDRTISLKKKMAETMRDLGRYESALAYFEDIHSFKCSNDPRSFDALSSHVDVVTVYLEQGRYMKAMDILQSVHEEAHNIQSEHPCTLKAERYIADVCLHYGIPLMACMKYKRIAEVQESRSPRSLDTLTTKHKLSRAYFKDGRYEDALGVIECVYDIRKVETPWHPDTKRVEIDFATMLLRKGNVSKAALILFDALENKSENFDFELVVDIPRNIAKLFRKLLNKPEEAIGIYEYLFKKQCKMVRLGPLHSETLLTKTYIADTYFQMGKLDKALEIFEDVLQTKIEVLGNDRVDCLDVRRRMAEIYFAQKKYVQSLDYYLEIFRDCQMYCGDYHDFTQDTKEKIDTFCLVEPKSPLINAIKDNDREIVEKLCNAPENIDIDAQDEFGCTPLHAAVVANRLKIVRYLIGRGASFCVRNRSGKIPSDLARSIEVSDVFDIVIKLFKYVKDGNNKGIAEVLSLGDGVPINAQDEEGKTVLHWACQGGDLEIVNILLNKGADPRSRDKSGESPLDVAARRDDVHIVEAMNRYVGGPGPQDLSQRSPGSDGTNHPENPNDVHIVEAMNRYVGGPGPQFLSQRSPGSGGTNHPENPNDVHIVEAMNRYVGGNDPQFLSQRSPGSGGTNHPENP